MALNSGDLPYAVISGTGVNNPEQRATVEFTVADNTGQIDDVLIAGVIRQALVDSGAVIDIIATRYTTAATEI